MRLAKNLPSPPPSVRRTRGGHAFSPVLQPGQEGDDRLKGSSPAPLNITIRRGGNEADNFQDMAIKHYREEEGEENEKFEKCQKSTFFEDYKWIIGISAVDVIGLVIGLAVGLSSDESDSQKEPSQDDNENGHAAAIPDFNVLKKLVS